jgi:glycosyltransferase involved in cell wall biosynthesis
MLHMSIDEPSANAYIEALASGLPIVTHDRSVTRWTLGDTSYLVDTEDVDATTNAIRKALDETPGLRTGERLTLVNNRYKWTSIAIQYTEAITAAFDAMTGSSQGTVVQK